jgi:hypothetical protein
MERTSIIAKIAEVVAFVGMAGQNVCARNVWAALFASMERSSIFAKMLVAWEKVSANMV